MTDNAISRQAALEVLETSADLIRRALDCTDLVGAERDKFEWGLGLIEPLIYDMESLPSVDAVQVVRCKDCKHSERWYRDRLRCFLWHKTGIGVFEDGYCNYAERKG